MATAGPDCSVLPSRLFVSSHTIEPARRSAVARCRHDASVGKPLQASTSGKVIKKRCIVADAICRDFERRFVERTHSLVVGDPMHNSTDIGPLAADQIVRDLEDHVPQAALCVHVKTVWIK